MANVLILKNNLKIIVIEMNASGFLFVVSVYRKECYECNVIEFGLL